MKIEVARRKASVWGMGCLLSFLSWGADVSAETAPRRSRPVPGLAVVIQLATERAPQVRLGQAALAIGRTGHVNAKRAGLGNPYVELFGQTALNGSTRGLPWSGTLWLPMELVGQRGRRMDEAHAMQGMYEASLEAASASALGEALSVFGATHVAAERVRILEQIVLMSKQTADLYQQRLAQGDAIVRDATMARVELARNEVYLREAHGRFAATLADLNRITGEQYDHVGQPELSTPVRDFEAFLARIEEKLPPVVANAEAEAKYYEAQRARLGKETMGPLQLMLMGGQGDLGEARVGAGLAYEFPVFRSQQGEKARAEMEKLRAQTESAVWRNYVERRVEGIVHQFRQGQSAYQMITDVALPAADEAVQAAVATLEAGKDDWFVVLLMRRDKAMLSLQRLDLVERQWSLLGELVQLTGEIP